MFEFFIALFGGLYYGNKYLNEKSKSKSYEVRRATWESNLINIKSRYTTGIEVEQRVKDYISSGEHYDEICSIFAEDFEYAIGSDWKDKLRLPTKFLPMSRIYGKKNYPWSMPSAHVMWVYHLILAKQGKIDGWAVTSGFPCGGLADKDMCVKFAECIERHLLDAGVSGVRLALELDTIGTRQRTPCEVCGGHIKIESLCHHPTYRLW